ncbi:tRNA nucleotidyltransferase (CCA-adding enzyme) [Olsenella profusa DSM 13989]|uniref:CCA tRNA nucleotidyltransferase n=1 Tax=Olsenella profusa TaxID=138595 RepID=UPI002785C551|nr:HD domain-containing protein [Olsenella profusa]MDP9860050.1 tRNA nucleotidyltransferase (CCA-adding enzyme) [Olsenella profusa DSM 13989]
MTPSAAELAHGLPPAARRVLCVLEAAGFEAWVVGGWVRDALRGDTAHDVDVTASAPWQETARVARSAGLVVHETGCAHGTVTVVADGMPIEVTTFRQEGAYSDHRHPDSVSFVDDVRLDLARRDFTINAMAFHPERGLLDPFGGRADLARGVIRAVGEPALRFGEDALRVLRAVRFACRLGFVVEPATQRALEVAAPELAHVARERIGQELDGIVSSGRAGWALEHETAVLVAALPELESCVGFDQRSPYHAFDVLTHTAHVCAAVEEFTCGLASRELRWAALLHDIAKPETFTLDAKGRGHFYGHPRVGAQVARGVLRRMALSSEVVDPVVALVRRHDHVTTARRSLLRRLLMLLDRACPGRAAELAFEVIDLKRADAVSKAPAAAGYAVELDRVTRALRRELASGGCYRVRDLAVGGADVIGELGLAPGPAVGDVLAGLLEAVIGDEVPNDRGALLAYAHTLRR